MKKLAPVLLTEQTAPGTPPAGYVYVYAKSDGKVYIKDDAGNEIDITTATYVAVGTTAPSSPAVGALWMDTN